MHEVLRDFIAVADAGMRARALSVGTGWVHVCDERALPPFGRYSVTRVSGLAANTGVIGFQTRTT
jgi:hypothetical protein